MDEAGVIKLPESPSPVQVYEFEISELNFENVQEAVDFFQPFNSDEAFVRPVISQGIAVLYLKGDGTKTVQQWNAFLSEHPLPIADLKSDASDTQPNNPNK